jgi:hypothetical protein
MQPLFYHDRRSGMARRVAACAAACALLVALSVGCSPAPNPQPTDGRGTETVPRSAAPSATTSAPVAAPLPGPTGQTPTADAIAKGRAIIEQVRAAAGGPALTALRSFEITGISEMTGLKVRRQLLVRAMFPSFFRQEETPEGANARNFHTVIGVQGEIGWIAGAALGGDGRSSDPAVAQRAHTVAGRQAMAGMLAGINAPWLVDSEQYTVTDGGIVTAGDDRGALIVIIDGPVGRVGRLLVDPGTHLPRRLIEPPQPTGGGTAAVAEIVFTYSDYQPQAGLQLPRTIVRDNGRNRTVFTLANYTLNPKLTPRQFSRLKQ